MSYKVLTRTPGYSKYPWRTHTSYETLWEAMEVASRLEQNTELEVLVEIAPDQIIEVPHNVLAFKA
jgi:hypothetical protein